MNKRFLVIDMMSGDDYFNVKEWIDINKSLPKVDNQIYKVRLDTGEEISAYYMSDKFEAMSNYVDPSQWIWSCWWSCKEHLPLTNVTHWGRFGDEK